MGGQLQWDVLARAVLADRWKNKILTSFNLTKSESVPYQVSIFAISIGNLFHYIYLPIATHCLLISS